MNGESSVRPDPDPTIATNAAVERAVKAERDYVDGRLEVLRERLHGIDVATKLLNDTVNRVPTDVTKEVTHLRELTNERFDSVEQQFKERDIRSERESRDNKTAVDAAFAAQKEAAAKQDESNSKAIDKSEVATAEKIDKLSELVRTQIGALSDKVDDVKERVDRNESNKQGSLESRTEGRATINSTTAIVGVIVAAIVLALTLYAGRDTSSSPRIVTVPVETTTP